MVTDSDNWKVMRNQYYIFILLAILGSGLTACRSDFAAKSYTNPSNNQAAGNPPGTEKPPSCQDKNCNETEVPTKVCYPGKSNQAPECFELISFAKLGSEVTKYKYLDPFTDPSFPKNFNKYQYLSPLNFVHAAKIASNTYLTNNFTRQEIMPANPSRGSYSLYAVEVLKKIEVVRSLAKNNLQINSAYRSPEYNSQLDGAAKWSRHTYGDAVDLKSSKVSLKELAAICTKAGAAYTQLYSQHVHCDWRNDPLDLNFYPNLVPPTAKLAASSSEILDGLRELSQIHVAPKDVDKGAGQFSEELELSATSPQEDPGELVYEWEIELPNQVVIKSEKPRVTIPAMSGRYYIKLLLGGNLVLESEFHQP